MELSSAADTAATPTAEEATQPAQPTVPDVTAPRLLALLFADWGSLTSEGKIALGGIFDRVFIEPPRRRASFYLFVRVAEARGEVRIGLLAPDGKQIGEMEVAPEGDALPTAPSFMQLLARLTFDLPGPGIYWFDVRYGGKSLGTAPLTVEERGAQDADTHLDPS